MPGRFENCPIKDLNIQPYVEEQTIVGAHGASTRLLVSTLSQSLPPEERNQKAVRIEAAVQLKCDDCGKHHSKGGECHPVFFYLGNPFATLPLIYQREDIPIAVKQNPETYRLREL